jgi:hypothetical protein
MAKHRKPKPKRRSMYRVIPGALPAAPMYPAPPPATCQNVDTSLGVSSTRWECRVLDTTSTRNRRSGLMSDNRHPSDYSDDQLRTMLRSERNTVTAKLITAKARLRTLVTEITELEQRLEHIAWRKCAKTSSRSGRSSRRQLPQARQQVRSNRQTREINSQHQHRWAS